MPITAVTARAQKGWKVGKSSNSWLKITILAWSRTRGDTGSACAPSWSAALPKSTGSQPIQWAMPALVQRARWEASQRPLFVKTVWQNGVRHAILSKDDPLFAKNEPTRVSISKFLQAQPSAAEVHPPVSLKPKPSELERCLMKLQLVLATEPKISSPAEKKRDESYNIGYCKVGCDYIISKI